MNDYLELLELIAPVFLLVLVGLLLRQRNVLTEEADTSILKLVVYVLYPCLIFKAVINADSVKDPSVLAGAPAMGFVSVLGGMVMGLVVAKALGFKKGAGLRTFCFSVGICNYGYIPVPLIQRLYGEDELAVLFVHNAGIELGIWTVGIAIMSGEGLQKGLRKMLNPASIVLVSAVLFNVTGISGFIPRFAMIGIDGLAACAMPIGLIMIGATIYEFVGDRTGLWETKTSLTSAALRLGAIPLLLLLAAKWLPLPLELKRVILVQAAMPAGVMPIVLAKHYGGQPVVALRIVIITTILGIIAIPFWIRFGEGFIFGS